MRALGTRRRRLPDAQVQDLMTATVIGCHPEDTANSVMEKMTDGRFRHMPVIEDNRMIGVISIGDVVKARHRRDPAREHRADRHDLQQLVSARPPRRP